MIDKQTYMYLRAQGLPAKSAGALARAAEAANEMDWHDGSGCVLRRAEMDCGAYAVEIAVEFDECPDFSFLGEIVWQESEGTFTLPEMVDSRGHRAWWAEPYADMQEDIREGLHRQGYSKHAAYTRARAEVRRQALQAWNAGQETLQVIVTATVMFTGVVLGRASLGGIDIDESTRLGRLYAEAYLTEVAEEVAAEAVAEADAKLRELKAS